MTTAIAILTVLDMCGGYLLPEVALLADVSRLLPEPVTLTTLRRECAVLEQRRQILSVQNEDKGTRYKITDNGRARLLE